MKCILASILAIIYFAVLASAQTAPANSPTPNQQSETGKRLDEYIKEQEQKKEKSSGEQILPDASTLSGMDSLDEPTKARALASLREYFDYRISGYQHRKEVFKWQLFSSKIIFWVVILLVLVGVYFSGIQFHHSLGKDRKVRVAKVSAAMSKDDGSPAEPEADELVSTQSDVTEIVASAKGIKVTSPVLGVIILVISLLFFYLYLMFVYPINEIL